jgi:hypothetical protein
MPHVLMIEPSPVIETVQMAGYEDNNALQQHE